MKAAWLLDMIGIALENWKLVVAGLVAAALLIWYFA